MTPDMTPEAADDESLYETLGVAETATAGEIKKAYFLLVKKFRPEDHPDEFNRFTKAHKILSDPPARREYDLLRRHGPQITPLTDRAALLLEEDPAQAVRLCKQAVVLAPEMAMPRRLLIVAFLQVGEFAAAEAETRRLLAASPDDVSLRLSLSRCLWLQDKNADAEVEARWVLTETPDDPDIYLLLSRILRDRDLPAQAITILEESIRRGGREDRNDREALLELLKTHVVQEDGAEAARTAARLYALAASSTDTDWISAAIYDLSVDFFQAHAWRGAWTVLQHVRRASVADPDLGERLDKAARVMGAHADASRMADDTRLSPSLRAFAHFHYLDPDDTVSEARQEEIISGLFAEAARDPRAVRAMFAWAAQTYPFFAQHKAEFLGDMNAFLDRAAPAPSSAPFSALPSGYPMPPSAALASPPRAAFGGGCLFKVLGALVLLTLVPMAVQFFAVALPFLVCAALIAGAVALAVKKLQD